jgi:uncharacterized NAD(P)/FAD-binding protein YdhS
MEPTILLAVFASVVSALASALSVYHVRRKSEDLTLLSEELQETAASAVRNLTKTQREYVSRLAEVSPQAAVIAALHDVEDAHAEWLRKGDASKDLDPTTAKALDEFNRLRNIMIHGTLATIDKTTAVQFASLANGVVAKLREGTS